MAIMTSVALMTAVASFPALRESSRIASMEIVAETLCPFGVSSFTMPFTAPSFTSRIVPLILFLALIILLPPKYSVDHSLPQLPGPA